MNSKVIFFCIIALTYSCKNTRGHKDHDFNQSEHTNAEILSINYSHLNHLYKELKLPNGKDAAIIHIYSNYPDYTYDIEPKEGFTCVDDVARAIVLWSGEEGKTEQLVRLTEFLLYMQNENGWFNNFIRKDLSINTIYQTSVAQPNWWSWRALWALEKVLPILENQYPELAERITSSINKLVNNTIIYLSSLHQKKKEVKGFHIATNLPYESAADQASILLIGLCAHFQRTQDEALVIPMRQLADGMLKMQIPGGELKGMFLSWENVWHAYANTQSYSLLLAGKILSEQTYIKAALKEIDFFYPYLREIGFLELMTLELKDQTSHILSKGSFPQIAYGIRPIVYACVEAYHQTKEERYREYAGEWISWFSGDNTASRVIYKSETGRCFDGIKSKTDINKNSGAESTIEALLSIQAYKTIN